MVCELNGNMVGGGLGWRGFEWIVGKSACIFCKIRYNISCVWHKLE